MTRLKLYKTVSGECRPTWRPGAQEEVVPCTEKHGLAHPCAQHVHTHGFACHR